MIPGQRPTIDPDLLATRSREYTVGAELTPSRPTSSPAGARLTRKELDRHDRGRGRSRRERQRGLHGIGNPGFGATGRDFFNPADGPEGGSRLYRPRSCASTSGSRTAGTRTSPTSTASCSATTRAWHSSDEVNANNLGRSSPNVNRYFDTARASSTMRTATRCSAAWRRTARTSSSCRGSTPFNFGTTVGGNYYLASGTPVTTRGALLSRRATTRYSIGSGAATDARRCSRRLTSFVEHAFKLRRRAPPQREPERGRISSTRRRRRSSSRRSWRRAQGFVIPESDFFNGFNVDQLVVVSEPRARAALPDGGRRRRHRTR